MPLRKGYPDIHGLEARKPTFAKMGACKGRAEPVANRLPQIGRISVVGIVFLQNPQKQGYVSSFVQRLLEKTTR
jgi:hypothetical protein